MHKKKIYHRLTGVACFLIGVFTIIFSLFVMPIGGSRAQTPTTVTFLPGQTFNTTLKSLATGATVTSHDVGDTLIQQIVRTGSIPAGVTTGLLSTNDSETPIIAWFDSGTIYYYTEADVIYLDRDSSNMFNTIKSGTYIDTSGWDTSNVRTMNNMFQGCSSLTELDVSEWNTSNVTSMQVMFASCGKLVRLDVSNWDTSNVTNMYGMFRDCSNLTNLDVSEWDTSKVIDMGSMFHNCRSLTGLDVSRWNTSSVTNMGFLFMNCSNLTYLDLSSWDTSQVADIQSAFKGCSKLETIYASTGFVSTNLMSGNTSTGVPSDSSLFQGSFKLVGGHGTRYDDSIVDKTRAVLDSETQSGYLTYDIVVSYRDRDNTELTRQIINVGSSAVAPDNITKTGHYVVSGWYTDIEYTTLFDFSQELRIYTEVYVDRVCADGYILDGNVCRNPVAIFEANGADSIGANVMTGLSIILPNITRSGGIVLGWSTDSESTEAEYAVGETIVLSGDTIFYAITKKTYTVTFQKNGATSIGATSASCNIYNTQTSCGAGQSDITICNPDNPGECLTMMDRNLGAGVAGTGQCSYGNLYQRGNNYGFPSAGSVTTGGTQIDCTPYGVGNNYSGSTFIVGYSNWCTTIVNDLWGGSGDSASNGYGYTGGVVLNVTVRQGPCPEGYHVPSIGEFIKVLSWWAIDYPGLGTIGGTMPKLGYSPANDVDISTFTNKFLFPYAGYRVKEGGKTGNTNAGLWSSSPDVQYTRSFLWNSYSYIETNLSNRATAYPIRCFKNQSLTHTNNVQANIAAPSITREGYEILGWSTDSGATVAEYAICDEIPLSGNAVLYAITKSEYTITFDSQGGSFVAPQENISLYAIGIKPSDPTRPNSIFSGWYLTGSDIEFDFQNTPITGDTTLYAHWDCEEGYVLQGEECVSPSSFTATFELNGSDSIGANIMTGSSITLPNIIRSGWTILGWSTDSGATESEYTVGENVTLSGDMTFYAITKKTYIATFEANGADNTGTGEDYCVVYNTNNTCGQYFVFSDTVDGIGTYTVCNTDRSDCLTMMDRNLGASLLGGYGQSYEFGQGQCPVGYHIPSIYEWEKVLEYRATGYKLAGNYIETTMTSYMIPVQGSYSYSHKLFLSFSGEATTAFYNDFKLHLPLRSSTIYQGGDRFLLTVNKGSVYVSYTYGRNSNRVRCFKDEPLRYPGVFPTITRSGGAVLGRSINPNATMGDYAVGDTLPAMNQIYYAITNKDVSAVFDTNGLDTVETQRIDCTIANMSGCSIRLPSFTRSGWTILGWNTDGGSTTAMYQIGDTITLTGNIKFYPITSKEVSATFKPNGNLLDGGNTDIVRYCTLYNSNNTCEVITPTITNTVTPVVIGYSFDTGGMIYADVESDSQVEIVGGEVYYAQTMSDTGFTYTAQFTGIIGVDNKECEAKLHNGNSQVFSCTVIAPDMPFKIGYSTVSGVDLITICGGLNIEEDDSIDETCITMMDRNLGAIEAGIGCDEYDYWEEYVCSVGREGYGFDSYESCYLDCIDYFGGKEEYCSEDCLGNLLHGYETVDECYDGLYDAYEECIVTNTGVYGNHYQRGNNHGFSRFEDVMTGDDSVVCSMYDPLTPFSGSVFTVGGYYGDYCVEPNDNMWGDIDDTQIARQGPCPTGYHVPSQGEWNTLMNIYGLMNLYEDDQKKEFQNAFKIPFAGSRNTDGTLYVYGADMWTSSSKGKYAITVDAINNRFGQYTRASGFPIRCFKNESEKVENEIFLGWTTESGSNVVGYKSGDKIVLTGNSTYYAVVGHTADVTYDANGGKFTSTGLVTHYAGDIVYTGVNGEVFTGIGTITITTGDRTITMLDRNLGAKRAGVGCISEYEGIGSVSKTNDGQCLGDDTYGYHFQWGNNHGFLPCTGGEGCTDFPGGEGISNNIVDISSYSRENPYASGTFIIRNNPRMDDTTADLWGGNGDSRDDDIGLHNDYRQGPCPEGWHVPSMLEWYVVDDMRCAGEGNFCFDPSPACYNNDSKVRLASSSHDDEYGDIDMVQPFQRDFLLPYAGYRDYELGQVGEIGTNLYMWTSTPNEYYFLEMYQSKFQSNLEYEPYLSKGYSVRCFYDNYEVYDTGAAIISDEIITQINVTYLLDENTDNNKPMTTYTEPMRPGYIFDGWCADTGCNIPFENSGIENGIIVYAKWTCPVGYMDNGDECVPSDDTVYQIKHYVKDAGLLTYSLYDIQDFTGTTNDLLLLSGYARDDIPCAEYMSGSLTGTTSGPGPVAQSTTIAPDGSTVLYLYYRRKVYEVDLQKDMFTNTVEGAGTYECGQEVDIRAYPLEGYHFDMWEGVVE